VTVIEDVATKAIGLQTCLAKNPSSYLMMPKTETVQSLFEKLTSGKNFTEGNFFLGMKKSTAGQWMWDDGTPVFVRCENLLRAFGKTF
jgi:hypothetical protein